MGGRQSSHTASRHESNGQSSSRHSTASLDNASIVGQSSGSIDFSGDRPVARRRRRRDRNDQFIEAHSLPSHLFPFVTAEIKCPVCNKRIGTNEIESHLLACLSKPRVSYNEDVLKADAGECIICFDDMIEGEHIARLPCLCIYHKKCLDEWFSRNRCCPAHPDQVPQEYADSAATSSANLQQPEDSELDADNARGEDHAVSQNIDIEPQNSLHLHSYDGENTNPPMISSIDEIDNVNAPSTYSNFENNAPAIPTIPIAEAEEGEPSATCSSFSPPGSNRSEDEYSSRSTGNERKTIVHVDDGSIHGSPNLFDEEEIAQLASKIKTILVQESPRGRDYEET